MVVLAFVLALASFSTMIVSMFVLYLADVGAADRTCVQGNSMTSGWEKWPCSSNKDNDQESIKHQFLD